MLMVQLTWKLLKATDSQYHRRRFRRKEEERHVKFYLQKGRKALLQLLLTHNAITA